MTARTIVIMALAMLVATAGDAFSAEASYECSGGTKLHAAFSPVSSSPGNVKLVFAGSPGEITLPQVVSADGGRYANDDIEFWIKGREATLTRGGKSETCRTD
ncbi:MliC family protein [Rhizobium sp. BK251]|uniref:MliC family protein n=1 Tax=Rhizobium sp. BK251 TaxID=2512125 RepID=UPI0010D721FE|nr:MliC family protein [Rhizobium sp. BK251]TCL75761.1 membrane-bound lysozyme inhibitor of c-type lysozyme MliC [Rhizobium sp. BK251]